MWSDQLLRRGENDRSLLTSCDPEALKVADELGARSVAFPLVSAGIYGWPLNDAASAAVTTIEATPTDVEQVLLVAFSKDAEAAWHKALDRT